ncbi:MAG: TonB-dependent receptor [Chloroherpetonaceae bacterium]|nr:TonB-dependent receptor [Chloroherpetonaceae bacterium]MDW8438211.1 TonB-dependent receptor [Chloroherpetonaceae bacterium]
MKRALLAFLLTLFVADVFAQVDSSLFQGLSLEDLQNLQVVSVTRSAQRSSDAPATVRIVTAEQIRLRAYQSLLDVLLDQPDFKIETHNDPRWQHDVQVRGVFGMDKFIILLDGVRISSPTNDILPVMENYPVHQAKQIEIVYGPASAVYGADALSGVINIVTRKAEGDFYTGLVQGGMFNTYLGNFAAGKRFGDKISFTASGQYFYDQQPLLDAVKNFRRDGKGIDDFLRENRFPTDLGFPQSSTQPLSQSIRNPLGAYALNAMLQIEDLRLNFFRNYSRNPSTTANRPNNAVYNEDSFFGHAVTMGNATYSKFWTPNFNTTSFVIYSQYDLDRETNFRNAYTGMNKAYLFSHGRLFKVEQLVSWTATSALTLSGGVTYENYFSIPRGHDLSAPYDGNRNVQPIIVNSVGLPNAPNGVPARIFRLSFNNVGAFLQAQYSPIEPLIFTLGSRLDRDSRFGTLVNPRLGIVYRPSERLTLKGLYGRAFLAPSPLSAYDEFGTFFNAGGQTISAFFRLANPNLGPQKIQTFELSARYALSKDLSVSFAGYYNLLEGLFSQVAAVPAGVYAGNPNTPSPVDGFYPVAGFNFPVGYIESIINQGKQTNYGGTAQLDYVKNFRSSRLALYAAFSFIDGEVDAFNEVQNALTKRQIGGISPFILRLGGDVVWKKFSFSPRLIAVSRQRTHPQQGSSFKPERDPRDPSRVLTSTSRFRQTIPGYALLNLTARYEVIDGVALFIKTYNALNRDYRTVNLGAGPDGLAGSALVEFPEGAPQNPFRLIGGVQAYF